MKSLNETIEYLGIQKATFYTWTKCTGVKSTKIQGRAYYDDEAIAILEELKAHLDNGGTFESWGQSAMVTASPESIEFSDSPESIEFTDSPAPDPAIAELVNNAQRQAAGVLIAQNVLARQFVDNPESLPPEFQALISKSKPVPKSIDPLQYAQTLTGMNLDFLTETPEPPEPPEPPETLEPENLEILAPLAA